jgi:hypothetical protein
LIVGASTVGLIQACVNSLAALAFLSIAIVGHLGKPMSLLERAALIVVACVMVVDPLEPTFLGLLPVVIGSVILARYVMAARAKGALPPARVV